MAKIFEAIPGIWCRYGIKVLNFLNYNRIADKSGSTHVKLNTVDILLAFVYMAISFTALKKVTLLVLFTNMISALKLVFKDLRCALNLKAEYNERIGRNAGLVYKSPYELKTIIEAAILVSVVIIAFALGMRISFAIAMDYVTYSLTFIMIIITFIEHFINMMVDYFQANVVLEEINLA